MLWKCNNIHVRDSTRAEFNIQPPTQGLIIGCVCECVVIFLPVKSGDTTFVIDALKCSHNTRKTMQTFDEKVGKNMSSLISKANVFIVTDSHVFKNLLVYNSIMETVIFFTELHCCTLTWSAHNNMISCYRTGFSLIYCRFITGSSSV